jgi:Acetyltransferase (GNAT) domain
MQSMRTMKRLEILRPEQHSEWVEVLERSFQYDFYHLPSYHSLEEECGDGTARLFVFREDDYTVALPLLLRPIHVVPGLEMVGRGWNDATSVYGYAGPVASHCEIPAAVLCNFQHALQHYFRESAVVSAFSRLNPLIPQSQWLAGLGECKPTGQTVSIDLTLPATVQRSRYRKNHKEDINRAKRLGIVCLHDRNLSYLDQFVDIYYETMRRVNAANMYLFDRAYFEKLMSTMRSHVHLFVSLLHDRVIGGALITACKGTVQYHLGGTLNEFLWASPLKLILDTVRLWANEHRMRVFHMGGGTGAQTDSVFHFKAGFTDHRHEFLTWRWVVLQEIYDRLQEERRRWRECHELKAPTAGYFPEYR